MSAIPIHIESPISPAKATAITPQTTYNLASTGTATPATTIHSSTATNDYPRARPRATAATPTQSIPSPTSQHPPSPQPGAAPAPTTATPSSRARGLSIPPPPTAGEKPNSPSSYAISQTQSTPMPLGTGSSQAYPPQIGLPPSGPAYNGIPPTSTTSTTQTASFPLPTSLPSQPSSAAARSRANTLEHPPGYIQNPQAQEMTPNTRFATEQASASHGSERSPVLPGYSDRGNAGVGQDEGIWDMAKKLVSQAGEKVQELEGEVWRKFGDGK